MNRRHRIRPHATPLARSELLVTVTDLVAEYELRHVFRNHGTDPIEAVYSFPVPLDSAFMGMEATLAGERRLARVMPRTRASRSYDDAIADGDSAVLLEHLEPGMLCVNLGNLKPGEDGSIVLRFAARLGTADGTARFSLPLVHRPRYGRSRLDELEEPRHDFAVEHPLEATIRVEGLLADAPVNCATHGVRFSRDGQAQRLRLNQAMLDRDIVLVFDLPADFTGQARLVRDGEDSIGVLSFSTPADLLSAGPCDVCLVLDGSGSMAGDAIRQSRDALLAVAGALAGEDRVQVLRFGSTVVPMFRRPLKASARTREAMVALADTVDADLGGTNMGIALARALAALEGLGEGDGRSRAVILVTDGAVHASEIEDARQQAIDAGIRIFIVAVGSSAGADVLAPVATATGAVLERAVPAEPIDEAVMRQLRRARQAGPLAIEVDWGNGGASPLPVDIAYAGDAVTAVAMLPGQRGCIPRIRINAAPGAQEFALHEVEDAPALRALAGHTAWLHAHRGEKEAVALRYGLVTEQTSAVLVKVRAADDKADGLPRVAPVAHMVPEGMVGSARPARPSARPSARLAVACVSHSPAGGYLDIPTFLRRAPKGGIDGAFKDEHAAFDDRAIEAAPSAEVMTAVLDALTRLFLDEGIEEASVDAVAALVEGGLREQARSFLASRSGGAIDLPTAARLFEELLAAMPGYTLSDDQDAALAGLGVAFS